MKGVQFQSLVGDLGSHRLHGQKKTKHKNRSNIVTNSIKTKNIPHQKNIKKKQQTKTTLCFQCRGHKFNPCSRNDDPMCCLAETKQTKNRFNSSRGEEVCNLKLGKQYLTKPWNNKYFMQCFPKPPHSIFSNFISLCNYKLQPYVRLLWKMFIRNFRQFLFGGGSFTHS